jgi:transposase
VPAPLAGEAQAHQHRPAKNGGFEPSTQPLQTSAASWRVAFLRCQAGLHQSLWCRRYPNQHSLVLPKQQKTRGKFYLLLCYEVTTGKRHWRFYEGKSSTYVCRFMRQVRRWYPTQKLWVALDQDRSHPRKAGATKRVLRALNLHWVSLPKASPDDNPVETIFSDIQLMILDNSDDKNTKTTRQRISRHLQRISRHLRAQNLRKDRWVKIHYLPDS